MTPERLGEIRDLAAELRANGRYNAASAIADLLAELDEHLKLLRGVLKCHKQRNGVISHELGGDIDAAIAAGEGGA